MAAKALAGIRVIDMSRILAAPLTGQILADFGAEVIRVERPEIGDEARLYGPGFVTDAQGKPTRESGFHLAANRNKLGMTLNLSQAKGQAIAHMLIASSDVLIENFLPGTMQNFNLGYEEIHKLNPRLICCSVTGYGHGGLYSDRPGYDAVFQAQSGLMSITGLPDGEPGGGPMRVGPSIVDAVTGYQAAIAILVGLLERERLSGEGQHADIALLDSSVAMQTHAIQNYLLTRRQPGRTGTAGNGGHPARVFETCDGLVYISASNNSFFRLLCKVIGRPEAADDERFLTVPLRLQNRDAFDRIAEPIIRELRSTQLIEDLVSAGIPASRVNTYHDLLQDPHVIGRGIKLSIRHPSAADGSIDVTAHGRTYRANSSGHSWHVGR